MHEDRSPFFSFICIPLAIMLGPCDGTHLSTGSSESTRVVTLIASLIMWIWEGEAWSFGWSHLEGHMLLQCAYLPRIRSSSSSRTLVLCRTLKFYFFPWVINESLYSSFWLLCSPLPCRIPLPLCLHSMDILPLSPHLLLPNLYGLTPFLVLILTRGDLKQSGVVHAASVVNTVARWMGEVRGMGCRYWW